MLTWLADRIGHAILISAGMAWQVGWSLVLGFVLSGVVRTLVPASRIRAWLGHDDVRSILTATGFGAASSSCSYASAAITRTLFSKGAALVPSLAFLLASTNLVVELGLVLWLLMGWQFALAEWLGALVLVGIMAVLVRATCPKSLIDAARRHAASLDAGGHEHGGHAHHDHDHDHGHGHGEGEGEPDVLSWTARLGRRDTWVAVADQAAMDFSMLWKDLAAGFLIAGTLAAFVPKSWWSAIFLGHASPALRVPADALLGPVVAVLSFVCSIGNVPLAAILWASGIGFGGVLAFLYADLIVLPLLDVYRRHYGTRMAAYIACVFFATMVASALIMSGVFHAVGLVPRADGASAARFARFAFDHTFWLDLLAAAATLWLFLLRRRRPS